MILLVRHAVAVARPKWDDDDDRRPLTRRGRRQAAGLSEVLAPFLVDRILSSPALRCVDTVAPMAAERGLEVEPVAVLREDRISGALELVQSAAEDLVLCTHGDVIEAVVPALVEAGWPLPPLRRCAKGATWVLTRDERCAYIPPPA